MGSPAQTNLQLYAELRDAGYSEADLVRVHEACMLANRLFPNAFRGSGKPLVAHLAGTASALVAAGAPADCVIAGLLHAAYALGDFGAGYPGESDNKRDWLRGIVGEAVEDLIARYTRFAWTPNAVHALRQNVAGLSEPDRLVVLVRLANELDDHADLGALHCRDADRRREKAEAFAPCVDLAREMGHPRLAEDLDRAMTAVRNGRVPEALRGEHADTFVIPPLSRRRWRTVRVGQRLRRLFGS